MYETFKNENGLYSFKNITSFNIYNGIVYIPFKEEDVVGFSPNKNTVFKTVYSGIPNYENLISYIDINTSEFPTLTIVYWYLVKEYLSNTPPIQYSSYSTYKLHVRRYEFISVVHYCSKVI